MSAPNSVFTIEDNVLKGEETPYKSDYTSLGKLILDRLENNEDLVGQVDPVADKKYTFREIRERSVRCALWMKSQGLLPGDVVAISSHNQFDAGNSCIASLFAEAVFAPLNAELNSNEIRHLLRILQPKMAFANEKSATILAEAAKDENLDLKIVVLGRVPGFLQFQNVIDQPTPDEVKNFKLTVSRKSEDTALIMCSSGTTGLPKGVALSHASVIRLISAYGTAEMIGNVHMCFSTLYWYSGTIALLMCLARKWINVITPPFEEQAACAFIEKCKVNWAMLSPSMINRLLKSDALGKYDLSSLKVVTSGGSPLSDAVRQAWAKVLPSNPIMMAYGSTELGCGATTPLITRKPGTCGRIASNIQLKVIDPDTGRTLGANQSGEFYLKTATLMNCYYNDPQATAEAIDEEGWLRTGDLGYYDEDGELFVVDRLKELLKYCNYQISPTEIESVILSHPGVEEAVVVGLPHPEDGDHPIAFVVRSLDRSDTGKQVTETDLINLVAAELSNSKQLRGGVKFVDSLPKTPSDKVRRKAVRDMVKTMTLNA